MNDDRFIGMKLANFQIERRLGQGGMATVYLAEDVSLQRKVAIKLIDARHAGDIEYARRFVEEARLIARWRHNNIIQVYYAGQQDDTYFYAMEYIEGVALSDLISSYSQAGELMPHDDVVRICRAIGEALDYAHKEGVIHRDVKPQNVMIGQDDRIVLMDFGLALDVEQGTMGEIFGTPHYISPEQARSSADVVPQSDLYSLAVMMYEMLVGQVPFDDPSVATLALQHLTAPPPPPRDINPILSEAVEDVLLKSLEKEADDRYQTGKDLIDALEKALKPETTASTLPKAIAGQRTVSGITVAERVALKLEETAKAPPPKAPSVSTKKASQKPETQRKPEQLAPIPQDSSNRGLLVIAVVAILLVIFVGIFLLSSNNNTDEEALPTLVAGQAEATDLPATQASTDIPPTTEATSVPPTDAPTDAPTDIPATETEIPATEIPPTATVTDIPTDVPTEVPTDIPTETATPVPPTATFTPIPSATPIPEPTVLYPDGRRMQMYWDANSFYLRNRSGDSVRVSPFRFESLDANGNRLPYAFDGLEWTRFFNLVEQGKCNAIEVTSATSWLRPDQCARTNSVMTIMGSDDRLFWREDAAQFRVLYNNEEVARCQITEPNCIIFLPPE